jgi:hypothetical protein
MRHRQLCEAAATILGVSPILTREIGRQMQRVKMIRVDGRGRGGHQLTPPEIASMFLAIMTMADHIRGAELEVARFGGLPCLRNILATPEDPDPTGTIINPPSGWASVVALEPGHTVFQLITAIFDDAMAGRLDEDVHLLSFLEIRVFNPVPMATFGLSPAGRSMAASPCSIGRMIAARSPAALYGTPCQLFADVPSLVRQAREVHKGAPGGALSRESAVDLMAFLAIARCEDRG